MRFRLASMTGGLAVGVTAAVAIACAAGTYLYSSTTSRPCWRARGRPR